MMRGGRARRVIVDRADTPCDTEVVRRLRPDSVRYTVRRDLITQPACEALTVAAQDTRNRERDELNHEWRRRMGVLLAVWFVLTAMSTATGVAFGQPIPGVGGQPVMASVGPPATHEFLQKARDVSRQLLHAGEAAGEPSTVVVSSAEALTTPMITDQVDRIEVEYKTVEKADAEPAAEWSSAGSPTGDDETQADETQADEPFGEPEPAGEPADEPAQRTADKPAEQPADEPADEPADGDESTSRSDTEPAAEEPSEEEPSEGSCSSWPSADLTGETPPGTNIANEVALIDSTEAPACDLPGVLKRPDEVESQLDEWPDELDDLVDLAP